MSNEPKQPECAGVTTYRPEDYPPTHRAEVETLRDELTRANQSWANARDVALEEVKDSLRRVAALTQDDVCRRVMETAAAHAAAMKFRPTERYLHESEVRRVLRDIIAADRDRVPARDLHVGDSVLEEAARRLGVDLDAKHTAPTPAEAAIFDRGGYVPGEIRIVPDPTVREGEMRATAYPTERGLSARIAASIRGLEQRNAEEMNQPRPTGGMVGLDAMLPPLTPATMLGEAVELANRAEALSFGAFHATLTAGAPDGIASGRVLLTEAVSALKRAQREAEARLANCPRGIHGGPGSDACDCAAIAKVETESQK